MTRASHFVSWIRSSDPQKGCSNEPLLLLCLLHPSEDRYSLRASFKSTAWMCLSRRVVEMGSRSPSSHPVSEYDEDYNNTRHVRLSRAPTPLLPHVRLQLEAKRLLVAIVSKNKIVRGAVEPWAPHCNVLVMIDTPAVQVCESQAVMQHQNLGTARVPPKKLTCIGVRGVFEGPNLRKNVKIHFTAKVMQQREHFIETLTKLCDRKNVSSEKVKQNHPSHPPAYAVEYGWPVVVEGTSIKSLVAYNHHENS